MAMQGAHSRLASLLSHRFAGTAISSGSVLQQQRRSLSSDCDDEKMITATLFPGDHIGPMTTSIWKGFKLLNWTLRKEIGLYANVRPCVSIPGYMAQYDNVDLGTIRENTKGECSGLEHQVVRGVVESIKIITRQVSMRVAKYAFLYSQLHVSAIPEANIMKKTAVPVSECCREVAAVEVEDGSHDDDDGENSEDDSVAPDRSVKWHVDKLCPTSLRVRQLKEVDFDDIIEREKKLKIVLKVKDLLLADPDEAMTLQDLGKCRDYIGLTGKKRVIALLKKFPGVFVVHEEVEPGKLPWFQLSPEAEAICDEEREVRKGMKVEAVTKLRKLLMMSSDKRLLLGKIVHIARDIGLPDDFRTRMVYKYPKYFRVADGEDVTNEDMRILELVKWSDRLAVTSEEQRVRDVMEEKNLDSLPKLEIQLPKRYRLSNKDKYVLYKFHDLECPSPYEASNYLDPASAEAEKRAVLLIKELLSLTLEKRLYVDHLTHFRKEFKFSNQVRGLLIRHPEHFYVSRKGARDTVFLREAFEGIHAPGQRQQYLLKDRHPLADLKEKYLFLMNVKSVPSTHQSADSVPLQESLTSQESNEISPQEVASSISV